MRRLSAVLLLVLSAGCASGPPAAKPTAVPGSAPTPTPVPGEPAPTPPPAPTGPRPASIDRELGGVPIRVLLERGRGPVTLPQPGRAYRVEGDGRAEWTWGPLEISAVEGGAGWQVGAWSSSATAERIAVELKGRFGADVAVWREETAGGLHRVKIRWSGGEPRDAGARLAEAGYPEAFVVAAAGKVELAGAAGSSQFGSEVRITPAGDWPAAVAGRRYRGRLRVRPTADGLLLINELALEDYLRGVVPVEMGPYVFPELEALKAQAVAARTYAVAHLGDHEDEGWDICDTPACQAYHGSGAEHPLSDRAISETAGLIAVHEALPIDAMYTSTCGGHTEDAANLFSGRGQPYLKGVECEWDRPMVLTGESDVADVGDTAAFRRFLATRALGLGGEGAMPTDLLPAVAGLCSGEVIPTEAEPGLTDWVEALFAAAGLSATGPLVEGGGADRLVRLADLFGIPLSRAAPETWDRGWHLEAVAAVLELQGVLVADSGEAVPHPTGAAIYPRRSDAAEALVQPLPLLWRWAGAYGRASALRVLPGTALERFRLGDRLLALVVVQSAGGGDADRRSAWRSWSRERSWAELETSLGEPDLERLEIVRRGVSGRVIELAVIDGDGNRRLIEGFEVRRALDLPETLFEMHERTDAEGRRLLRFLGRGWGHGVGLCQNGAYGLARSGMDFEAILKHYYTGVEISDWR